MSHGEYGTIHYRCWQILGLTDVKLTGFKSLAQSSITPLFVLLGGGKLEVERTESGIWLRAKDGGGQGRTFEQAFEMVLGPSLDMRVLEAKCGVHAYAGGSVEASEGAMLMFKATSRDPLVVEMEEAQKEAQERKKMFADMAKVMRGMRKR